jgi:uncharacterized protein YceK
MNTRIAILTTALLVAGCTSQVASPPPGGEQPSPGAATPTPSAAPTEVVYYEVTKNAEGDHGGAPLLDLPASVVVDYDVHGSCRFEIGVATPTTAAGLPRLAIDVPGPVASGTWQFAVTPGSYVVTIGEATGCTYRVQVHSAG